MEMHGKSIRIPGPQDLRARRVVHRDPVPGERRGEAGAPGHYRRQRGDTRQSESAIVPTHDIRPDRFVKPKAAARGITPNIMRLNMRPASRGEPDVP